MDPINFFFICAQFAVIASLLDWKCLGASQKDCWCSVGFNLRFSLCHFFYYYLKAFKGYSASSTVC